MQKIGLIGVGNIGQYYSKQLLEAGYPLTVLDLDHKKMDHAVRLGAHPAETLGELAQESEIIIFSLPGSHAVESVMDGEQGLLKHMREDTLVIDTGTSKPETDIRYERLCSQRGIGFLDAPITWRSKGLTIMVGGEREHFEKAKEVLQCISYKLKYIGSIGHGQVLKLINQSILANQVAIYAEAVELATQHDLDPRLLQDFLEFEIPEYLYCEDYSGGGQLALHYKDLGYLLEMAHHSGANIPLSSLVHEIFKTTKLYGDSNWIQPGIATYWKRLNQVKED